jgi:hypothetical protein
MRHEDRQKYFADDAAIFYSQNRAPQLSQHRDFLPKKRTNFANVKCKFQRKSSEKIALSIA